MKKVKIIFTLFVVVVLVFSCKNKSSNLSQQIIKDIDGNEYKTTKIGAQIWMVEILKTTQ